MRMSGYHLLLLIGLAALGVAHAHEDTWEEKLELTVPTETIDLKLKLRHTASPLFIQNSDSKGVTKLGFDAPKFAELKGKASDAKGQEFTVENFLGVDGAEDKPLCLSAFDVFAEDAKLVMANEDGTDTTLEKPDMVHLRGSISGDPSSLVLLHISAEASFGLIQSEHHHLSIEADPKGHSLLIQASAFKAGGKQAKELFAAEQEAAAPDELDAPAHKPAKLLNVPASNLAQTRARAGYSIGLAVDCDQQCVARLNQYAPGSGQGTDARTYLTALIAGTSAVYQRDIGREIVITYLRLWDRASPFDSGTNSLTQYRTDWQNNAPTQNYDLAHLMTGIQEGGVAYVGTVCNRPSNVGVSSLRGQWQGATSGSTAYMWDLEVTAHELGHNFGSGHSHDYSPPIDECVSCRTGFSAAQCQSGGSAVGPVERTDARCVKGTVMSYCHLCGGMTNIDMRFHPRAITQIQGVVQQNCGAAGPAPPSVAPTPAPPQSSPTPAPAGSCTDQSTQCSGWGSQYCSGSTTVNGQPFTTFCCAQCTAVSTLAPTPSTGSTCTDQSTQCSGWGSQYCSGSATVNGQPFATFCCAQCA